MQSDVEQAAKWLKEARKVVAFTGAGVSKESGIPTFRDKMTGLWEGYDPMKMATPEGFLADPPLVWRWYDWRRKLVAEVEPNPGHHALVEIEKLVPSFVVITQNVDGLHRKAGSKNIIELHGSIARHKCFGKEHPAEEIPYDLQEPPTCACGSPLRPDVVWFGEALRKEDIRGAFSASEECDVMMVIGTSALVQPAASLPYAAKQNRARIIEVNPDETPLTDSADCFLQGPSGDVLPKVVRALQALGI